MVYKWVYCFKVKTTCNKDISLRFISTNYESAMYKLIMWFKDNNLILDSYEYIDNFKAFE